MPPSIYFTEVDVLNRTALFSRIAIATLIRTFWVPREAGDPKRPNQRIYSYISLFIEQTFIEQTFIEQTFIEQPRFIEQSLVQWQRYKQWLIGGMTAVLLTLVLPLGGNSVAIAQTLDASSFPALPSLNGEATVVLTVKGEPITIQLKGNEAPITAGNFVKLVNDGFYDGLSFHRVVRSPRPFVVQGGDPQSKDPNVPLERLGTSGYTDPATGQERNIPLEILPRRSDTIVYGRTFDMAGVTARPVLNHTRGAVAMARSQSPNSGSSQFYITLSDQGFLDGKYAVFGYVTEGMDVVDKILQGDRIESAVVTEGVENLATPAS